MKKFLALMLVLILTNVGVVQAERDDNFHKKYKLESVLVFSRHNIRSPTRSRSAMLATVTPHKWFKWTSNYSELSLRGGECETIMGQYFKQWLMAENLIPNNYTPAEGEVRFYANSRQRTIATARFFSTGMLPVANAEVEYKFALEHNDPVFVPALTLYNEDFDALARSQIKAALEKVDFSASYKLLNKVIDFKKSDFAKQKGISELTPQNLKIDLKLKGEPGTSEEQSSAALGAADALLMQYYETGTAFGRKLSFADWKKIANIKEDYLQAALGTPAVAVNGAHPILQIMNEELSLPDRKFTFLCGHDSTIAAILGALEVEEYDLPKTIEHKTPIGVKVVIGKWRGEDGAEYASLDLVYATSEQLLNRTTLTLDNPPVVFPLNLKNIRQNSDGIYNFEDFRRNLQQAIDAYDDLPQAERAAA